MSNYFNENAATSSSYKNDANYYKENIIGLDEGWEKLEKDAIGVLEDYLENNEKINLKKNKNGRLCIFTNQEYSDMYTTVYNMCTQRKPNNWSSQLYKKYCDAITMYLLTKVIPVLRKKKNDELLKEFLKRWTNHLLYVKWLERFFAYLDRFYVKVNAEKTLRKKAISIFFTTVFDEMKESVREAMLNLINRSRNGEAVDDSILRGIVDMLIGLENGCLFIYQSEFEDYFLVSTAVYFTNASNYWLQQYSFSEYLHRAQAVLIEEENRCIQYLDSWTLPKLKEILIKKLLTEQQKALLQKDTAVHYLLENEKQDELRVMYNLYSLVEDGLLSIAASFKDFIKNKGNEIVETHINNNNNNNNNINNNNINNNNINNNNNNKNINLRTLNSDKTDKHLHIPIFVQSIIDLHDDFKSLAQNCFTPEGKNQTDPIFQKAIKEGFEEFLNVDMGNESFAFLLSSYCDRLLRRSDDVENTLVKVVEIFNYVAEKDLFAEHYRSLLARRLLHETSASEDAEKSLISKLKMKCGAQFTSKLEGMLNDLSLAGELQKNFKDFFWQKKNKNKNNNKNNKINKNNNKNKNVNKNINKNNENKNNENEYYNFDFNALVLTTGFWPTYPSNSIKLPIEMTRCIEIFEEFYAMKTKHRRLSWVHTLGNVVVSGRFATMHDLICNVYQASVLLLFNSVEKVNFCSIKNILNFEENFLKKIVSSLFLGKFKILQKTFSSEHQNTSIVESTFKVNENFTCVNKRIKIPTPVQEETHTRERVEEDRSVAVEAAIVRIMKTRKILSNAELVSEVLNQLSFFKPNPKLIKNRIEHLIEREYLEIDPTTPNAYRYKA